MMRGREQDGKKEGRKKDKDKERGNTPFCLYTLCAGVFSLYDCLSRGTSHRDLSVLQTVFLCLFLLLPVNLSCPLFLSLPLFSLFIHSLFSFSPFSFSFHPLVFSLPLSLSIFAPFRFSLFSLPLLPLSLFLFSLYIFSPHSVLQCPSVYFLALAPFISCSYFSLCHSS